MNLAIHRVTAVEFQSTYYAPDGSSPPFTTHKMFITDDAGIESVVTLFANEALTITGEFTND